MNINLDSFTLTIIFLIVLTLAGAFVSGRRKDRCLKDFIDYMITMEQKNGKQIWGRLSVAPTGLELNYLQDYIDRDHVERSFILYKNEFSTMHALFRFHDDLSEENRQKRDRDLDKAYHPRFFRRLRRMLRNILVTIRDSLGQVSGMLIGRIKGASPIGGALASQQKQLTQIQTEMFGMIGGTAYDQILERYIGHRVVLEIAKGDEIQEHVGILKEYSPDFLEVMDIWYSQSEGASSENESPDDENQKNQPDEIERRRCDLIVPRSHSVIRHGGELAR